MSHSDRSSPSPTLDDIVAEIARIDVSIDQQRTLNDQCESRLFLEPCEGEKRKSAILSIALRDELIDELLTRRSLLMRLLAG